MSLVNIQGEIQSTPLNNNFNDLQNQINTTNTDLINHKNSDIAHSASDIVNDSNVSGSKVSDALNNLNIKDGQLNTAINDRYTKDEVDIKVSDLQTQIDDHNSSTTAHNSDNIVNGSSITGNNVSEALNNLKTTVDNITTGDSNANIGVYSATDNTNTNDYAVTISGLSYFGGLKINLTVTNANTDTATLNINALGAKTIKIRKSDGTKVDAPKGSVKGIVQLEYDGTDFILLGGEEMYAFANHKTDNMPHKFQDNDTGKTYKYGFKQENGFVVFMYEEVI
jgi:hypothetical protein